MKRFQWTCSLFCYFEIICMNLKPKMPNDGLDKYSLSLPDVKKMLKSTSKK